MHEDSFSIGILRKRIRTPSRSRESEPGVVGQRRARLRPGVSPGGTVSTQLRRLEGKVSTRPCAPPSPYGSCVCLPMPGDIASLSVRRSQKNVDLVVRPPSSRCRVPTNRMRLFSNRQPLRRMPPPPPQPPPWQSMRACLSWSPRLTLHHNLSRPPPHRQSKLKLRHRIISSRPRLCHKRRSTLSSPEPKWRRCSKLWLSARRSTLWGAG